MANEANFMKELDEARRRITWLYQTWAEQHGISCYEFSILYCLGLRDKITQKEIVYSYVVPKQTISYAAQELCKKGLIRFVPSETDRREKYMVLTESGKAKVKDCILPLFEIERSAYNNVGAKRAAEMLETEKLVSALISKGMNIPID